MDDWDENVRYAAGRMRAHGLDADDFLRRCAAQRARELARSGSWWRAALEIAPAWWRWVRLVLLFLVLLALLSSSDGGRPW